MNYHNGKENIMLISFAMYSFLGYIMESLYISLIKRKWVSSGLLKGPYIPLYGFGALILINLMPYMKNPWICIIIGGISMTCLELLSSYFIEKVFHKKCWDYSKHYFNFQGRICLFYTIIWCSLSYLFVFFIHPNVIKMIPYNDITLIVSLIFITFISKSFIDQINHSQKKTLLSDKV